MLSTDEISMPDDDVYLIGVDGDVYSDPIPRFTADPFCEGVDTLTTQYSAL